MYNLCPTILSGRQLDTRLSLFKYKIELNGLSQRNLEEYIYISNDYLIISIYTSVANFVSEAELTVSHLACIQQAAIHHKDGIMPKQSCRGG